MGAPSVDQLCRSAESAFERQDYEAAETSFRQCLDLAPDHAGATHGLGVMALAVGDLGDAVDWFTRATRAAPQSQNSWWHLSQAHLRRNEVEAADAAATTLYQLNPAHVGGLICRGHVAARRGRPGEAVRWFGTAAWLAPRNVEAGTHYCQWAWALGRIEETIAGGRRLVSEFPADEKHASSLLTTLCADPATDEAGLHRHALAWAKKLPTAPPPKVQRNPARRRPRLGILSKSFHEHVIGRFLLPLLRALPRDGFESIRLFHDGGREDEVTAQYRSLADEFVTLASLDDGAAHARLQAAELDVLLDINGHFDFARARLLAHRPAPVIIHYLGGACMLGLPDAVQYRIADAIAEPPGESDRWSTERILRLPHGFHTYAPLRPCADVGPLPAIRAGQITFGTTAALYKLNDQVLRLWARVLDRVPGSRLLLVKEIFRDPDSRDEVLAWLVACGIPGRRLELRAAPDHAAFTEGAPFADVDIALDPFPYNGVTTTCEALWMGVPVVALRGRRLIARTAASLLTNLGHQEWIADDPDEYVALAAALAADAEALVRIRSGLRAEFQRSPLGNSAPVATALASALQAAWAGRNDG